MKLGRAAKGRPFIRSALRYHVGITSVSRRYLAGAGVGTRAAGKKGEEVRITPEIEIEDWELTEHFVRASGPGGQHVNKVATAVELRFEAARSPNVPDPVKSRLRRLAGQKWTRDGAVVIRVDETRSQARNREIARERLAELIRKAAEKPKPRRKTRVPPGQKKKRLEAKKRRGEVKAMRGRIAP